MKKNLLKIDQDEKNSLLEMHRNRGYKTIVEEDEEIGAWGWEDDIDSEMENSDTDDEMSIVDLETDDNNENIEKKREEFFGSLSADDFDQDFETVDDVDISNEEFMEIYNSEMSEQKTKEKEKEKEKTKETEKDKKRRNPFRDPNPGTEEDPRGEKKTNKLKEGKKVVRLTEDELVNLIKKMINE